MTMHVAEAPVPLDAGDFTLSQAELRQGLRIVMVAGVFGMTWLAVVTGMPLVMFMEALGASGFVIGLMSTVNQLAMVCQIPGAFLAERLSTRRTIWAVLAFMHRFLWFIPAVLPFFLPRESRWMVWTILGVVALSGMLGKASAPIWYSWMADLIPEKLRSRFWGRRQSIVMMGFLAALVLSGSMLDFYADHGARERSLTGFRLLFAVAAACGCADILIHLRVPEPRPMRAHTRVGGVVRLLAPFRNRDFTWLTLSMGGWFFCLGVTGPFGHIYLKRTFHVTYSHLASLGITAAMGSIVAGYIWGYAMDRIGSRVFGVIMMLCGPFCAAAWFFLMDVDMRIPFTGALYIPQPVFILMLAHFVAGAFYSGVGLCQLNLISVIAPRKGRTMAMAVHWLLVGCLGGLGSATGGLVMDYFVQHPLQLRLPTGVPFAFMHVLLLIHVSVAWFFAVPMLLKVTGRAWDLPVGTAMSRLFIINPLRAASSIYNINVLGSSVTRDKCARAIRELGHRRTAIAVSDLIEKLDDPSTDVREEAANALGMIGSPDAVRALVDKLEDPHSDIAPQIARALRFSKSSDSVDALVRKLAYPDRETQSASARTLGEIGDHRATASLFDLLHGSDDPKIVSASSEALARLGEIAAIYDILPKMKAAQNPVLKQSLAVAIGDLLGEPEGFYSVLVKERREHGAEVEKLLKNLRKKIDNAVRWRMTEEGRRLINKVHRLAACYEDKNLETCSNLLFELAIGFAALTYGVQFGENAKSCIDHLIWRDQRFGIGVWYLDLLRQHWEASDLGRRDEIDILLGIYFLSCVKIFG